MKIIVNGEALVFEGTTLADLLDQLGKGEAKVATAVNERFVPGPLRKEHRLNTGDRVEIVAPRQGG